MTSSNKKWGVTLNFKSRLNNLLLDSRNLYVLYKNQATQIQLIFDSIKINLLCEKTKFQHNFKLFKLSNQS